MNSRIYAAMLMCVCVQASGDEAGLRDPTAPFNSAHTSIVSGARAVTKVAGPRWILEGILISDEGKKALLNGRWYKEQDLIDGWQVAIVEASSIVLKRDGKVLHVPMYPSLTKNTVNHKPE
ncbi:MAG TPA: hypothetical protein VIZ65_17755 [Cellvibrionaceae bacterium]